MDSFPNIATLSSSAVTEALKKPLPTLAAVGTLSLLGWRTLALRSNYLQWKAMGPGGMPYNPFGWALAYLVDLALGQDAHRLDCYDKALDALTGEEKALAQRRFLDHLPPRRGPPARALPFAIPQRQKAAWTELEMVKAQTQLSDTIAAANRSIVTVAQSKMEPQGNALWLADGLAPPAIAAKNRGEICHIHESDGSYHVTLSYADAREVIEKGWGERHRVAGTYLNLGYTFVYAPRDEDEVEVMGKVFRAGIAFMTGGKEVA